MKVLLIGDANRITGAIADKLNKEGHRVFALMSSKRTHYRHVYEKYILIISIFLLTLCGKKD